MSAICRTHVDDDTSELVLIVLGRVLGKIHGSSSFNILSLIKILGLQVFSCVLPHIQLHGELTVVIQFNLRERLVIELESFQYQQQDVG